MTLCECRGLPWVLCSKVKMARIWNSINRWLVKFYFQFSRDISGFAWSSNIQIFRVNSRIILWCRCWGWFIEEIEFTCGRGVREFAVLVWRPVRDYISASIRMCPAPALIVAIFLHFEKSTIAFWLLVDLSYTSFSIVHLHFQGRLWLNLNIYKSTFCNIDVAIVDRMKKVCVWCGLKYIARIDRNIIYLRSLQGADYHR